MDAAADAAAAGGSINADSSGGWVNVVRKRVTRSEPQTQSSRSAGGGSGPAVTVVIETV